MIIHNAGVGWSVAFFIKPLCLPPTQGPQRLTSKGSASGPLHLLLLFIELIFHVYPVCSSFGSLLCSNAISLRSSRPFKDTSKAPFIPFSCFIFLHDTSLYNSCNGLFILSISAYENVSTRGQGLCNFLSFLSPAPSIYSLPGSELLLGVEVETGVPSSEASSVINCSLWGLPRVSVL